MGAESNPFTSVRQTGLSPVVVGGISWTDPLNGPLGAAGPDVAEGYIALATVTGGYRASYGDCCSGPSTRGADDRPGTHVEASASAWIGPRSDHEPGFKGLTAPLGSSTDLRMMSSLASPLSATYSPPRRL